jgi:hypothetical protein
LVMLKTTPVDERFHPILRGAFLADLRHTWGCENASVRYR